MGFFYSSLDLHLDINWQELTAVFCRVSIFRFYFNIKKEEEGFIYLYV